MSHYVIVADKLAKNTEKVILPEETIYRIIKFNGAKYLAYSRIQTRVYVRKETKRKKHLSAPHHKLLIC